MIQLTATEARVLGVLVEKAMTTPEQYPLSLNAATNGANQKNNRDPVLSLSEDEVFEALEGLRGKGLVVRVDTPGNRVHKYRHNAGDVLHVRPGELAILAELMMRGPQTLGELRGRANRMSPLESLEVTQGMLDALMTRGEPLVRELPPAPGTRAQRFMQLLGPDEPPAVTPDESPALPIALHGVQGEGSLAGRVERLESEVQALRESLRRLAEKLGQSDY
jgi:uncharacterized protein YceH (UPF0502 family)